MARRGAGEGSIYRRADGKWVGAVTLGYQDGKRRRKAVYSRTRRQVVEGLTRALRDHQAGLEVPTSERETVQAYLGRWLEVTRQSVRPATATRYEGIVRLHLIPSIGRTRLTKLSPREVQAMLNGRLAAGLSPRSVGHVRGVLRAALAQAYRWGLLARNVATMVDVPQVPHQEVQPLTPDQARAFLQAAEADRHGALFTTALTTGLRQGELLGLAWADVDVEAATLTVRHALQRVGGRLVLVEPKTQRSRRTIALPVMAAAALREHRRRQAEERLLAGDRWRDYGLVFTSTIGTPLDGTNVTHRLQVVLERAGLPRQRFHDLRHGAASLLVASGTPMRQVMELLGHSDIRLTMNTYAHVAPVVARDTADRMDAVLSGGAG